MECEFIELIKSLLPSTEPEKYRKPTLVPKGLGF